MLGRLVQALVAAVLAVAGGLGPSAGDGSGTTTPATRVTRPAGTTGADISWPQCPRGQGIPKRRTEGKPMPSTTTGFVVVGLTNGPALTPNPCLDDQVAWAARHHVPLLAYAVVTYPSPRQLRRAGSPAAFGTTEAAYLLRELRRSGLDRGLVLLDVEPYPLFPWSSDVPANAAVVRAAVGGLQRAGVRVGLYSTTTLWPQVVGDLRLGLPEWRTAGPRGRAEAARRCGRDSSFQGGAAVVSQWWGTDRLYDVLCARTIFTLPAAP